MKAFAEDHWDEDAPKRSARVVCRRLLYCIALLAVPAYLLLPVRNVYPPPVKTGRVCAQEKPLRPSHHESLYNNLTSIYKTSEFSARAAKLLGGAVKIPTEVYDSDVDTSKPVDKDDKTWHVFNKFSDYLKTSFPKTHSTEAIDIEKVNTYALLYTWKGSNSDLKPILLMAHQDVVPVAEDIRSQWKHGPFSGELDEDGWLWGRGSMDDKSGLIGVLSSVETLLEQGFKPQRTIIMAFGYDEEISGKMGARYISRHLEDKLGKDSIALIVDEGEGYSERSGRMFAIPGVGEKGYLDVKVSVKSPGGHSSVPPKHTSFGYDEEISGKMGARYISRHLEGKLGKNSIALIVDEGEGYSERSGRMFAIPGVGEKGYLDVKVSVKSPGGHSSVPPKHTSIGYLAQVVVMLEANSSPPHLSRESPMFDTFQCIASWAKSIPAGLKDDILASKYDDEALARVEKRIFAGQDKEAVMTRALLSTTTAIDIIHGGIKANALPEEASAIVNHRISTDSSLAALQERYKELLTPLAQRMGMSLKIFGNDSVVVGPSDRIIEVSDAYLAPLEPAPKSPLEAEAFKLLSGTIRASYEDAHQHEEDNSIIVAPGMMSGNTDTRYYWDLTPNIYRYNHLGSHHAYNGVHTINEAIKLSGFVDMIKFFTNLILNADENSNL